MDDNGGDFFDPHDDFGQHENIDKIRNNDPELTFTDIKWNEEEFMTAVENNTVIDSICFQPNIVLFPNEDYSRLYNHIRLRSPLRRVEFYDQFNAFDFNQFLVAASENSSLQELDIRCFLVFANHALESFHAHRGLKKLCISYLTDQFLGRANVIKRIIETCPRMQHIEIMCYDLVTVENFEPIVEAIYKMKSQVVLELSHGHWDQEATVLLQKFLHDSPHPVQFSINLMGVKLQMPVHSSLLTYLVGSSVTELIIDYGVGQELLGLGGLERTEPDLASFMKTLAQDNNNSLKKLWFKNVCFERDFLSILDGIPDLSSVQEIKIGLNPSCHFAFSIPNLLAENQQFLHALTKNVSITMADLHISADFNGHNPIVWNAHELTTMKWLSHRNQSITGLLAFPDSIILGALPWVFQAVQNTHAASSLIFRSLRCLTERLFVSSGWDNNDEQVSKRRRL